VNQAGSAAPWLDEIQRTAGDISPATATEIQRAAEYAYQQYAEHWGQAWGQYAARQSAKEALAGAATETDPEVVATHRAYQEAREHADMLFAASAGPDGRADLDTPEGLAAWVADNEADEWYEEYREVWGEATVRHSAEVKPGVAQGRCGLYDSSSRRTPGGVARGIRPGIRRAFRRAARGCCGYRSWHRPAGRGLIPRPARCGAVGGAGFPEYSGGLPGRQLRSAARAQWRRLACRAGPSGEATVIPAWPPACTGRCQQRLQPGWRHSEARELREVPATDQAIRASAAAGRPGT
jgi:hypothetical protein